MAYDILGDEILGDDILGDDILGADLDNAAALLGLDDISGDDILGDDIVGAARRRAARKLVRRAQAQAQAGGRSIVRPAGLVSKIPGVQSGVSQAKLPLGFGTLSCTDVTNPTGGNLTASPQKPVRPRRLVINVRGVNAANYAVAVTSLIIGTNNVLASAQAVDARAFEANAFDVNLLCESAQPGIAIAIAIQVTPAVGVGDSVIVTPTFICDSLN